MKLAPKPLDEAVRMDALLSLNLLNTEPEERFDRLARLAKHMFRVPIAQITLVDDQRLWFKSSQGFDAVEVPRETSFCGHTILNDNALVIADALQDDRFHDNPFVANNPHLRFYAGCPLVLAGGSRVGTLCLFDMVPRMLEGADLSSLIDIAKIAEHELTVVQQTTFDDLTMVANRRGFRTLAQNAFKLSDRLGTPSSMLFFDLNGFKGINDRFGHGEGDLALKAFAAILKRTFRETDVIGRLGGDEFVVYMVNSPASDSLVQLERLAQNVRSHNEEAARGYDIAYSVGHVIVDKHRHATIDQLLHEADSAMYADKKRVR